MRYESRELEERSVMMTAAKMCAAARTAPKGRGIDRIETLVLTGEEKDRLADKMEEIFESTGESNAFFKRDAGNVRDSEAVVLIGTKKACLGLSYCGFCGFENCGNCGKNGGSCAFDYVNLGIALSSAAVVAQMDFVDNRIMFSIGKAWMDMEGNDIIWFGIPLSVTGKSKYFDR
ncbi:ferredoxin domain-containing protein [Anaerotignum sp.]